MPAPSHTRFCSSFPGPDPNGLETGLPEMPKRRNLWTSPHGTHFRRQILVLSLLRPGRTVAMTTRKPRLYRVPPAPGADGERPATLDQSEDGLVEPEKLRVATAALNPAEAAEGVGCLQRNGVRGGVQLRAIGRESLQLSVHLRCDVEIHAAV